MAAQHTALLLFRVVFICQLYACCSTNITGSGCIESERRVLMEFKASLVDNSSRLSSWIGRNCCSWNGITCNIHSGRVEKLDLRNPVNFKLVDSVYLDWYSDDDLRTESDKNCLTGKINSSILALEGLLYLDLSSNHFRGIIPDFLGSLKALRYLDLSNTGFRGQIPPHLGNLSNLEYLFLGNQPDGAYSFRNYLNATSLEWITKFPSLRALDISDTNLSQSHDSWDSINMLPSSLSSLSLRGCDLVPPPLFSQATNFTSLLSLDIGNNYLNSSFPFRFFNLSSKLQFFCIHENHIIDRDIAFILEKSTSLNVLDLSFNSFSSSSTLDLFCNMTSLTNLNLRQNQFNGSLPLCLGNLTSLTELNLDTNKLGGKIPNELGSLKQLLVLDLSYNYFNSSVPSTFGNLRDLTSLRLNHNQLSGVVPLSLGNLSKLQTLDISSNSVVGELSESHFMKLRNLKYLDVSYNRLLGLTMSSQWIPPFQLQIIRMDSINIGTQFPLWLQIQKNVNQILLSSNKIHGSLTSIPPKIEELNLSDNLLTGLFDTNQTIKSSIQYLLLDKNHLTGNIPHELCNLLDLRALSLSSNLLTGNIPSCIGNLRFLYVLDLANNNLFGRIPSSLGKLALLEYLHLSRNQLSGMLPSSLRNMKELMTFDVGKNQLWGPLAEWINGQELYGLQFLNLHSNGFYGNIAITLCHLQYLQVLNLAQNNLTGQIPHCFGNFSAMKVNSLVLIASDIGTYTEKLQDNLKGIEQYYSSNLPWLKSISLSGNNIDGDIPGELMDLDGLQSLNLSNNQLSGRIPEEIGNWKQLESLDLAMNHFSGPIPPSMASIDSLGFLNLSFNNLSGTIPLGNHFQTLITDHSVLEGNSGLCGKPFARSCSVSDDVKPKGDVVQKDGDEFDQMLWFYAGMGPGFAVGFLIVLFLLIFKASWRHAYFGFLNAMFDRLRVA